MSIDSPQLWRREGLIQAVQPGHPWWASHAQLPTVLPLSERLWRIYFGARNAENRTSIIAVDVDPADRMRIVAEHFDSLLPLGAIGAFDHRGVIPSAALLVDGKVRLYYIGVFVREDVRAATAIGLAESSDGLHFHRAFDGPVFGLGPLDPYSSAAPAVIADGGTYRMFYIGGTAWRAVSGIVDPFYELRTTTSPDGNFWDLHSQAVLPSASLADGRPWVAGPPGRRRLWFSRRGEQYRVAGSGAYCLMSVAMDDRGRAAGMVEPVVFENPPQPGDFDDWMQAYGCVLPYGDDLIMVYNGNGFGQTGFGWARLPGGAIGS